MGLHRRVACRQLIDCTGGADVVGMLGYPRLREAETQPGTLIFGFAGYDAAKLDAKRINARYHEAMASGELHSGDYLLVEGQFVNFLRSGGYNSQHLFIADSSTSATKTQANLEGRASALRLLRFIRSLPGCEKAILARMQPETAVRETYRILGETVISQEDYVSGRVFPDAVGYAFYPVDLHNRHGVKPQPLREGVVATLPLSALAPKGSRNLLAAGRSISSDRMANSGLRVQAPCMAMGQAAGAAAALAARQGITPLAVPLDALRAMLREHGAIVPG